MVLLCAWLAGCATGVRSTHRSFNTVVLDAGHGGHDPGALSRTGLREKVVALDVTRRLEYKLQAAGFDTVMTRTDDRFIPLGGRVRIANRKKNAIFVSVHFNHSRSSRARGVEVFYHHPYGKEVATRVQNSLLQTGSVNRGVKRANFHVLRNAKIPAILIECGFLSNSSEEQLARRAEHRERLAEQIARGLVEQRFGHGFRARRAESRLVRAASPDSEG